MPMPALLRSSDSLDSHWEEIIYTEARLLAAGLKPQAAACAKAIRRLEGIDAGQRAAWRREIVAQAHVDTADDALDDQTESLSRDLLHLEKRNRNARRYKQYFKGAVSVIVRLGLASQIPVVRAMTTTLASEPEKALKQRAKELTSVLKKGDEAVTERRDAAGARAAHRAREIVSFVDDLNALRATQHAELTLLALKKNLPRDYADRFFRRSVKTARALDAEAPVEKPSE